MNTQYGKINLLYVATLLGFSCVLGTVAVTQAATVTLPPCGNDPSTNTKTLQAKIDLANPGDTLVLPAGVCVVAKCEIAHGQICYDPADCDTVAPCISATSRM